MDKRPLRGKREIILSISLLTRSQEISKACAAEAFESWMEQVFVSNGKAEQIKEVFWMGRFESAEEKLVLGRYF